MSAWAQAVYTINELKKYIAAQATMIVDSAAADGTPENYDTSNLAKGTIWLVEEDEG